MREMSTGVLKIGSSSTARTCPQEKAPTAPSFAKFMPIGTSDWIEKSRLKPAIGLRRSQLKLKGSLSIRNRLWTRPATIPATPVARTGGPTHPATVINDSEALS